MVWAYPKIAVTQISKASYALEVNGHKKSGQTER